jgi:branched-chain amino acid transport system ATP-binding protein
VSGPPILEVRGLTKQYGDFVALRDVDLTVEADRIQALIGPNGAGKTTLFGVVSGELRPTRGTVRFDGRDVTRLSAWRRTRAGMVRSFQVVRIFPTFSVAENVAAAVAANEGRSWVFFRPEGPVHADPRVTSLLEDAGLAELALDNAAALSQGDRKRLEIAMALALDPRLLLLDEPTAGMSPVETFATVRLIRRLWEERGCAVLLTEHDMSVVFDLAHVITVLHRGEILRSGDPESISRDPEVLEVYLGGLEAR